MKTDNKYSNRLMKIFDIQVNFLKHKEKITKIKNKNLSVISKKVYNSHMNLINSFRKAWGKSQNFKSKQKEKQLLKNNNLLHQHLDKQYKRRSQYKDNSAFNYSRNIKSQNSTRSLRSSSALDIQKENKRIIQKILIAQSSLSKKNLIKDYKISQAAKQRLQIRSFKNRKHVQRSLRKMNIQSQIYFPKIKKLSNKEKNPNKNDINCVNSMNCELNTNKEITPKLLSAYVKAKIGDKKLKNKNKNF